MARLIVHVVESLNGIRAVQAFRRESPQRAAAGRPGHRLPRRQHRGVPQRGLVRGQHPGHRQPHAGGGAAGRGDCGWPTARLELGALTAFLLYLRRFYDPLDQLAQFYNTYQSAAAALEKIATLLDSRARRAGTGGTGTDAGARARRAGVRPGAVRLPAGRRPDGAAGVLAAGAGRADGRAGRRDRSRQVHAGQAGRPVPRPDRRAWSGWTASTCATSPTPSCAGRW